MKLTYLTYLPYLLRAQSASPPPGKSYTANLDSNSSLSLQIDNQDLAVSLNTENSNLYVISSTCAQCSVPHPFSSQLEQDESTIVSKDSIALAN